MFDRSYPCEKLAILRDTRVSNTCYDSPLSIMVKYHCIISFSALCYGACNGSRNWSASATLSHNTPASIATSKDVPRWEAKPGQKVLQDLHLLFSHLWFSLWDQCEYIVYMGLRTHISPIQFSMLGTEYCFPYIYIKALNQVHTCPSSTTVDDIRGFRPHTFAALIFMCGGSSTNQL